MKHPLIFHIGLEKTGTKSFQQFCSDQERIMNSLGVHYPKQDYLFKDNNHSEFVASYLPEHKRSFISNENEISHDIAVNLLTVDMNIRKHRRTLLSSEHFSSRFSECQVERLAQDFSRHHPQIIAVVRDHSSLIRSAYSTHILSGTRFTMTEFIDALWEPDVLRPLFPEVYYRYCRYREMLEPWERFFGKENVKVLKYQGHGTLDVILSEILGQPVSLPDAFQDHYNFNRTIDPCWLEYVRLFNMILPDWGELYDAGLLGLWPAVCAHRGCFLSLIAERAEPDLLEIGHPLDPNSRARIAALAAADHDWLADRGIRFDVPEPGVPEPGVPEPGVSGPGGGSGRPTAARQPGAPALRPDLCALLRPAGNDAPLEQRIAHACTLLRDLETLPATPAEDGATRAERDRKP